MLYPQLVFEPIVQSKDRTRFDATETFTSEGETLTTMTLQVGAGTPVNILTNKYLDFVFEDADAGTVNLVLEISDGVTTETETYSLTVKTAAEENLFSVDSDILPIEPIITKYYRKGRFSHLDKHREAQTLILNELDENRIWKRDGTKYTATDIVVTDEFREWSKYKALELIFRSNSNQIDDIHERKAKIYKNRTISAKKRASYSLDADGDGDFDVSVDERTDVFSNFMERR